MDIRESLKKGEVLYGCWQSSGNSIVTEALAGVGFDWIVIDMEHSAVSLETVLSCFQAMEKYDVSPFVRVPSGEPTLIKRVLDIGAFGVVVPNINNRKEADRVVKSSLYPPEGMRGLSLSTTRNTRFGLRGQEYPISANQKITIVLQIETKEGVRNIEEIVKNERIDVILVGPSDLSADMGRLGEWDHPEVVSALEKVERAAKKAGVSLGVAVTSPEKAAKWIEKGYQFIGLFFDVPYLAKMAQSAIRSIKKSGKIKKA